LIWYEERAGIHYAWVRLPGEPARCVGERGDPEPELIGRAARAATNAHRIEELETALRQRCPNRQLYRGPLPQDDTSWDGPPGEYVYVLGPRRWRGKYRVRLALRLDGAD
jgi:hypothetical protein